ncbi:MAG TPA: hypothetical protein VKG82_07540 [Solirubrobacteraceae bacterium]|nr:hypothetical protein [Solirubrobacteraceae bacterium]
MALDGARLGTVASEQMEALEEAYGDDPDAQIGAVITIVQVLKQEAPEEYTSSVRMRVDAADPYQVIGLMRTAEAGHLRKLTN